MSAAFKANISTLQIVEVVVNTSQKWVDQKLCDQRLFGRILISHESIQSIRFSVLFKFLMVTFPC